MIILASQSPRRRDLLERAGISFTVRAVEIDERVREQEAPQQYVRRLAVGKAMAVPREAGACVLAADTTVVLGSEMLGKPADDKEAARMLTALAGRSHEVITGICLFYRQELFIDAAVTTVHFGAMTAEEIESYVATGEPMDKAGAYAIQGIASRYITGIEGCYSNVVGLPVSLVCRYLGKLGVL